MAIPRHECDKIVNGIDGLVTEAWGQGFMVGSLIILLFLTVAGMRRGVLLHKLIVVELLLALTHGTFIFVDGPAAGWYTSSTAALLYISYNLHNVINWIKINPFLGRQSSRVYIGLVALAGPYWIMEIYLNFALNNGLSGEDLFPRTRPWEALCREPWWIFTTIFLIFTIKRSYSCGLIELIRTSTRFGILLIAMGLSVVFIITDIVVVIVISSPCKGENPFWKVRYCLVPQPIILNTGLTIRQMALVFKCVADTIFLDDFKSVLDQLSVQTRSRLNIVDLEQSPGMQMELSRESAGISQGMQYSQPRNTDTIDRTVDQLSVLSSPGDKALEAFEHLENTPTTARQTGGHTTKEWFDDIDL